MQDLDAILTESVSEAERVDTLLALNAGLLRGMKHLLQRLNGYHSLLELELEESPAGRDYLQEGDIALRAAFGLLKAYQSDSAADRHEHESIDLKLLVTGVATRLKKIGHTELVVDFGRLAERETFVWGKLYLLQQVFFALPALLADASPEADHDGEAADRPAQRLHVHGRVERLDEAVLSACKSELVPEEYVLVIISRDDITPTLRDLVGLFDKTALAPNREIPPSLVLTYGTVLRHGGDVFCVKGPDGPQAMVVALPLRHNRVEMYSENQVDEEQALRGTETILLVDDEGIIWDVVIDMLKGLGYLVILAADGKECVQIYKENPGKIDLVLLDMVMPEMNGHDAFFALREIDPSATVLLSSGYVDEEDARDVLDAGAIGFLRKPYRMVDLARKIRGVFDAQS